MGISNSNDKLIFIQYKSASIKLLTNLNNSLIKLKSQIEEEISIKIKSQLLYFNDQLLEDDTKKLIDYKISEKNKIKLIEKEDIIKEELLNKEKEEIIKDNNIKISYIENEENKEKIIPFQENKIENKTEMHEKKKLLFDLDKQNNLYEIGKENIFKARIYDNRKYNLDKYEGEFFDLEINIVDDILEQVLKLKNIKNDEKYKLFLLYQEEKNFDDLSYKINMLKDYNQNNIIEFKLYDKALSSSQIFVKFESKTVVLEVDLLSDDVESLKKKILIKEGIDQREQIYKYAGKILRGGKLYEFGIHKNSTIFAS